MVISTSISCTLQPLFTGFASGGHTSFLAQVDQAKRTKEQSLWVPAQEIRFWKEYREDDYVIYHGWVGTVTDINDEVTIRLSNGSVVVVEDPAELEEVLLGCDRHRQRLESAGYVKRQRRAPDQNGKELRPAESCYPGQIVITKKGNLRRGRWIFGAYNPAVEPEGMVVDVRIIGLEVSWSFPNVLTNGPERLSNTPPIFLDIDVLQSGEVIVYDHNKLPRKMDLQGLENACHCEDIRFGLQVRFKDEAGAALKYDAASHGAISVDRLSQKEITAGKYRRIPRTETQGYDMNVLQIDGIRTKVMVQWQDGTVTAEDSTSLVDYLNVDDHDLWTGEIVSLKEGNEYVTGGEFDGSIHAGRIGVVQSINSIERIANIRWFENPKIYIVGDEQSVLLSNSRLGPISNNVSEVSLYDLKTYPALTRGRGDMVLIVPNTPSVPMTPATVSYTRSIIDHVRNTFAMNTGGIPGLRRPVEAALHLQWRVSESTLAEDSEMEYHVSDIVDWFGEVVGLDLEGQLTVRLGALPEARDVKISVDRAFVIAGGDDMSVSGSEAGEDESESGWGTMSTSDGSTEAIGTIVEYEGGRRLDADHDDEMWMTDEDDASLIDMSMQSLGQEDTDPDGTASPATDYAEETPETVEDNDSTPEHVGGWHSIGSEVSFSTYPTMPSQFLILDNSAPSDHHYFTSSTNLSASLMRRIIKEHKIMHSSLPDGIFVRTWESRLDLLRVLIVGPRNTPYELAPFVIDFHFNTDFPRVAPEAFFHSWTGGVGRINPNLYEDGKICLSLLGTWPADDKNESWSPAKSSMLQIIVSLMGLVLVKEPYYSKSAYTFSFPGTLSVIT